MIYSGCGNTFLLADNREGGFILPKVIETDGIVLLENSSVADIRMRIFNKDGRETEMCGNGLRCLIRFLEDLGDPRRSFSVETMERILQAENLGDQIAIAMGEPTEVRWNLPVEIDGKTLVVHHLNTGVPHAISFEETNLQKLRHAFPPKGANANYVQIESHGLTLTTFERGVEAVTPACGTGATAAALAAAHLHGLSSPIAVQTPSKEFLHVSFHKKGDLFIDVALTGPAHLV